ncbi:NF-X1 finger and helicase domain protein [Beauveria bassiana ARSEF 2860]|uniref:NF-X1 finger and helicase domain protein n=1 Tax=Beauveria bassiana (strain ARSEF 2860) TaxID=655819 RepID=J5JAS6_BEAB2|nr:NF-X1 finger and helicase domain protein [Beauveria bassiana ARSEF 2860]EJP61121.1 NF-X1 finger and helicase domain protein [Beauveria bassiana ARSEF 2860]
MPIVVTVTLLSLYVNIHGLLSVADGDAGDFADAPPPAYPRGLHMPSDRHDNGKTDVADMNIFPTRAEIFSEVVEFLPSTDPEQPHFLTDKSQRHIDTLFRLLRQDTFGELKYVLASTLRGFEIHILFSGRHGLEADILLSQLPTLRGKSSPERGWWEDSRRLAEGCARVVHSDP